MAIETSEETDVVTVIVTVDDPGLPTTAGTDAAKVTQTHTLRAATIVIGSVRTATVDVIAGKGSGIVTAATVATVAIVAHVESLVATTTTDSTGEEAETLRTADAVGETEEMEEMMDGQGNKKLAAVLHHHLRSVSLLQT